MSSGQLDPAGSCSYSLSFTVDRPFPLKLQVGGTPEAPACHGGDAATSVSFHFDDISPGSPTPLLRTTSSARAPRGTANCGRGVDGELDSARTPSDVRRVPGSQASTMKVQSMWNSLFRWLLESKAGKLTSFCRTVLLRRADRANIPCTPEAVWPLPFPYSEDDMKLAPHQEAALQRALNFAVLVLNWLQLGEPSKPPVNYSPNANPTSEQMSMLQRLRRFFVDWSESPPIDAAAMGRSAAKVESLEDQLAILTAEAERLTKLLGSGRRPGLVPPAGKDDPSLPPAVMLAKDIESERLKFSGAPAFDPSPLLSAATRKWYQEPLQCALPEEDYFDELPHVQVRGQRAEILKLLRNLDRSGRLKLFLPHEVRLGVRSGLFSLMKNLSVDRLIMDCRPPNCLEEPLSEFTQCMASPVPVLDMVLRPGFVLKCSGEDLKDFYYFFCVSTERAARNSLAFELTAQEAKMFQAVDGLEDSAFYVPALATMAMGDINSVEYGQAAHTMLALNEGVRFEDLLCMRGRAPRQDLAVGLVIDDLIVMEQVLDATPSPLQSELLADKMVQAYSRVGLVANDSKRFRAEERASFWGIFVDGREGLIRAQLERIVPAAMLTSQVARNGVAERKLLETLAGMWTAVLQMRRPAMCLLSVVFDEIQNYDYGEVFQLKPAAVAELWALVALAPLLTTDLRAQPSSEFALVDASDRYEAEVTTEVEQSLAAEMARQRLSKAAWSKLLSPLQSLRRLHQDSLPEDEVPAGEEPARSHPLWTGVVRSSRFALVKRKKIKRRVHINLSELNAAMSSLERRSSSSPNKRLLLGSDSQVVLGALVRGRSSSKTLNQRLRRGLPHILAGNTYVCAQYIPTKLNVADDPTRDRPCRAPDSELPEWIEAISHGDYEPLDSVLEKEGVADRHVARLPTVEKVPQQSDAVAPLRERLRQEHWRTRVLKQRGDQSRKSPPNFPLVSPWMPARRCKAAVREALNAFPLDQFVFPPKADKKKLLEKAGHLDLFSGSRSAARALAEESGSWVLTFDTKHSANEDLLAPELQRRLLFLVNNGAFLSVGAGPVCASFSRAVRPPVRSKERPRGLSNLTANMAAKVDLGNAISDWLSGFVTAVDTAGLIWWVENPAGSYLWSQPEWEMLQRATGAQFFLTDYCRFGTPYRKRTRFLTNSVLAGEKLLCQCNRKHLKLVGYSKLHGCSWTRVAEPYPSKLSQVLAKAVATSLLPEARQVPLDLAACARSSSRRIGEARNPGPRARRDQGPFAADLELVDTVQPATRLLQAKVLAKFDRWIFRQLGEEIHQSLDLCPKLRLTLLRTFGNELYRKGEAMYLFRHLVVCLQQQFPGERSLLAPAWDLLTRWEIAEPVTHRPPMPRKVVDAFISLALAWGWYRWAAITALAFHGAMRVGEPLRAVRADLVLPREACLTEEVCFVCVRSPKPGRRGRGKTQRAKVSDTATVRLVSAIFEHLDPLAPLYPSSASSFRRRWDRIAATLEIPDGAKLTPGSLRAGGTVHLYHSGIHIMDLMWRLRLKHQATLESYLQETGASGIYASLPSQTKANVEHCAYLLPHQQNVLIARAL